jgi:AGZA family xanthine/uracil permease-like MFS transporter
MKERGATVRKELVGAFATFMSMAYILAVNPRILSDSGGPCVPDPEELGGIFGSEYNSCIEAVKREYITSTAIASMAGCLFMGFAANLPIALAPGMGMNAYFTYSVVGFRGTSDIAFDAAITAVLIEGIIFFILAVTGLRHCIVKLIPEPVRHATPAAIGAFLAHLGLQTAEGLGIVVADVATAVTLGGCPVSHRTPMVQFDGACAEDGICVLSDAYTCDVEGGIMTSGATWAGIVGTLIMLGLLSYKSKGAFVIGISLVTVVSWIRNTSFTYFPDTPLGDERFDYFKQIVSIESLDKVLVQFTGDLGDAIGALITFLYVDFFDTSVRTDPPTSGDGILPEYQPSNPLFLIFRVHF